MADIDDLIDYIRQLRKGYDKDFFKHKIEELGRIVDTIGLTLDDFSKLFKLWLNLSIPYFDWSTIGLCLVPRERVEEKTVQYVLRWLLVNCRQTNYAPSRIALVLDWLTAAMDSNSIDMKSLDYGYEIYISLLYNENLSQSALRLVYMLTKPSDINRRRVLSLLQLARIRDTKKSKTKQINVLLSLFKSRKPEFVPECIPNVSVQSVFRNINHILMERFWRCQACRKGAVEETLRLEWVNPINALERGKGKEVDHLIPNMEFVNIGSTQYSNDSQKNYLDFTESSKLLAYSREHVMSRPSRLRAMFCNDTALALLSAAQSSTHAFLEHDLHYLLVYCFFQSSHYKVTEKKDFLRRLAYFQRTLLQGIPVVTKFLIQYLPFWDDRLYFAEVLQLVEWISLDELDNIVLIVEPLARVFYRCSTIEKCAILNALTNLYTNMTYTTTRSRLYFMDMQPTPNQEQDNVLSYLINRIGDMCNKALQIDPESFSVQYMSVWCLERAAGGAGGVLATPPAALLALPLVTRASSLPDRLARLLLAYNQKYKELRKSSPDMDMENQRNALREFTVDYINALMTGEIYSNQESGRIFKLIRPEVQKKLKKIPGSEKVFEFRSHLAFAPYTYTQIDSIEANTPNKLWFEHVIAPEFSNLNAFFSKISF